MNPPQFPHTSRCDVGNLSANHDRTVNRQYLVNKINHLNFQDKSVLINLRHLRYGKVVSLGAKPLPCTGNHLECLWAEPGDIDKVLTAYQFEYLLVPDRHKFLIVHGEAVSMDAAGITLLLPPNCREFKTRKIKRHPCPGIATRITHNSALFHGPLVDFTPVSFLIDATTDSPHASQWIMVESIVNLSLYVHGDMLYSANCTITRKNRNERDLGGKFVLKPTMGTIQLIKPKQYRNERHELVPSPNIVFRHPLIGNRVNLKVADLSGSGFSVEESEETSTLLPGLIIPELGISFAHGLDISCKAQVVSRKTVKNGRDEIVRCGLAILDMDIREHVKLLSILHQAADRNSYVCTDIDPNDLWDFFFETGFIYPEKYSSFQANKERIKQTYDKLYGSNPHIARHFIYLERGVILGHMAMVRFYENSWMIHHHASRKTVSMKAGLTVLNQVGHYLNELQNLPFSRLHYVYCYFRPENRFPNRLFGEFARQLNDPSGCSLDKFAYLHYQRKEDAGPIPEPWDLTEATPFDFMELKAFYDFISGGLMIEAFDLQLPFASRDDVGKEYTELGFRKEKHIFALRREGAFKAMVIANCTDAGFNMANLTNCVTFMALDDAIPEEIVEAALGQLTRLYENEMPVLIFPFSFAERQAIPYEKTYMLWILDLHYSDDYFRFCDGLLGRSRRNI